MRHEKMTANDDAEIDLKSLDGLTIAEAKRRLARFGENTLAEHKVGIVERIARYFWGPIPWTIEASAVLEHWDDLSIIVAMLLINAGVGF